LAAPLNPPVYVTTGGSGAGKATQDPSDVEDNDTSSQRVLYRIGYAASSAQVQINREVIAIFPAE